MARIADNLPIEIWENILRHLSCDSWKNLAKAFDVVNDAILSIKKTEIVKCQKSVKRIPYEHYLELEESPKKISKDKVIEAYVNHWKFHSVDTIVMKPINYSDAEVSVDCMNLSGLWVFLYAHCKGWTGFRMVHLTSLARTEYKAPRPWVYVQKFNFVRSVDYKTQPCYGASRRDVDCWCSKDLGHDFMQVLLTSCNMMQGDVEPLFLQLHPMQPVAYDSEFVKRNHAHSGSFYVTRGKYKLVFHPQFGFDEASFASDVKNPHPHVFVFDGPRAAPPKRRILLDVSVNLLPGCNMFRAILFILDQTDESYKLLFLHGPRITHTTILGPHRSLWLFRGALAIALRASGKITLVTSRRVSTLTPPTPRVSCVSLRGNLLVLGTRDGALLLYRSCGKASELHTSLRHEKELRVANVGLRQILFAASPRPELLVLTMESKLYHLKL